MNGLRRALVVSTGKNAAWVCLDGETAPRLAQLRRQTGKRFMPVSGDVVYVRVLEDEKTCRRPDRTASFHLERRSAGGRSKTMAANVDTMVTVMALADPAPRLIIWTNCWLSWNSNRSQAIVVLTKPDLRRPGCNASAARSLRGLGLPRHSSSIRRPARTSTAPARSARADAMRCLAGIRAWAKVRSSARWAARRSSARSRATGLAGRRRRPRGSTACRRLPYR